MDTLGADFQVDGEDTLQRLVAPAGTSCTENAAIRSEWAAEYLAWELIYPHELRREDVKKLEANKTTIADLGRKYDIPNHIVETVLSKPYMEFAERWWAFIWQEKQAKGAKAAE